MEQNTVTARIGKEKYVTELTTTRHHLIADEPEDKGGSNAGPAPGEFLRLAIASCTAITLRMYADRKQWNVDEINVQVSSKTTSGKTIFNRSIEIKGNIDEAQRERFLQIADSCPIHNTLTHPIEIETGLTMVK
jgi:putative redox protein